MPGMVASRRLASFSLCHARMAASIASIRSPKRLQLSRQPSQRLPGQHRHRGLILTQEHGHEVRHPADPLWSDDAQLGHVPTKRIHQHGPLAHQQVARPVQHQHRLLLGRLDRHEAHRRPRHRLADRLGVGRIRLAALDVGLHVGRRHQPDLMAQGTDLARPVMRRAARLDANQAGRQALEERQHLRPLQLAPQHRACLSRRPRGPGTRAWRCPSRWW